MVNNNFDFPKAILSAYEKEHAKPIEDDLRGDGYRIIRRNLLSKLLYQKPRGDVLKRSVIRHDADTLGRALLEALRPL